MMNFYYTNWQNHIQHRYIIIIVDDMEKILEVNHTTGLLIIIQLYNY